MTVERAFRPALGRLSVSEPASAGGIMAPAKAGSFHKKDSRDAALKRRSTYRCLNLSRNRKTKTPITALARAEMAMWGQFHSRG